MLAPAVWVSRGKFGANRGESGKTPSIPLKRGENEPTTEPKTEEETLIKLLVQRTSFFCERLMRRGELAK